MCKPCRNGLPSSRPAPTPYDRAGADYTAYADGNPEHLFAFQGLHAYADRRVWTEIDAKLRALKARGARHVRFLDTGCGPGTWLRRVVAHAHWLGFDGIDARGFDVASVQIETARHQSRALARLPGVTLRFELGDLMAPLPESDASVDLTLCLYSVLCHLPRAAYAQIAAEFARVTRGHLIATVRTIGSTPTIFVGGLEKARDFHYDHAHDRSTVELADGTSLELNSHLFSAHELRECFGRAFAIDDVCGLDLFHGRFAPDRRWNSETAAEDSVLDANLDRLEARYAHNPAMMDRANHLILVARSGRASVTGPAATRTCAPHETQ